MRYVGSLVSLVLGSAVLLAAGCKAGTATGFGGGGSSSTTNPNGSTVANGTGVGQTGANGSTAAQFMTGAVTTGTGTSSCSTSDCIGGGMQGGCDAGLALESGNAIDGAKAIGLCQQMSPGGWGLVTASWVRPDGSPLGMGDGGPDGSGDLNIGHGILSAFGSVVKPREGSKMLGLSSGSARQPNPPDNTNYHDVGGWWKDNGAHTAPPGYPKDSPSCPPGTVPPGTPIYDSAGLKLVIHTPKDAKSISFDENFYTYEFPGYICSQYNDFYVAMLSPKPAGITDPAGNIAFDAMNNSISVNAGFLQVCTSQMAGGKNFPCQAGPAALNGTGFEGHAATGWLTTKAPVPASTDITLTFAIWDSGDGILDSTVLIDNFKFEIDDTVVGTNPVM